MPHSFQRNGTMALRMCLLVVLALLLAANPTEAKHRQLESLEELLERLIVEYEAEAEELKEDEEEEEETGGGEDEEDEEDEAEEKLKKKEEEKKRKKKKEVEEQNKKEEEEEKRKQEEEEASKPKSLHRDRDSQITKTTEIPLQEATTIQYSTTPRSLGQNIYTKPGSPNKKCYCEEITDTIWPFTVASGGKSRQGKGGDSGAREAKGNDGSSENNDGKSSDGVGDEAKGNDGSSENIDGKSSDGVGDEAKGNDGSSENNDGKSSDEVGDKESDNPKEDNNSGDSERVKRSPIDAGLRQPCLACGPKPKPDSLQNERHLFHHQCLH